MLQRSFCLATVDRGLVGVPAYHSVRTLSGAPMCCVLVETGVMDGIAEPQNSHVDRSSWFWDFSVPGIHSGQLQVERIDFLGAFIAHQQGRVIGTQPQPRGPRV